MKGGTEISWKTQREPSEALREGCGVATKFEGRIQCVGSEHRQTGRGRQVQGKTTQGHGENNQMHLPREQ